MAHDQVLQRAKFPMCCGATILFGFGKGDEDSEPTHKEIEAFLNKSIVMDGPADIHEWHDMFKNAFHMAILNQRQKDNLHSLFVKSGFEVVSENYNAHSGSTNYLYVRKVKHYGW